MKTKLSTKITSILLFLVMFATMLPLNVVAAALEQRALDLGQQAAEVRGGIYTAEDGTEYAVLYNDYITAYVSTFDGGFTVLPATESFDSTKPLSHASFQINGETFRYGAYYDGLSGAVSVAPQVNENGILEALWQIGDFVISQIFAITSDTSHDNSYVVKVGYAAQYFGDGSANIAGRILLDTQFTSDESVPVLLMDSADNLALVESETAVQPVPVSALISKEFIEESNLAAAEDLSGATPVYQDMPNKGYIVFDDYAFAVPDRLVFAEFGNAYGADYEYAPNGDIVLFGETGFDSAALLYWDEVVIGSGGQAAFGTNYGFFDMLQGDPQFTPVPEPVSTLAALSGTQTVPVIIDNINIFIPEDWFEIYASVLLSRETDSWGTVSLNGEITDAEPFQIQLRYKTGTPQVIRDSVTKYDIWMNWEGGNEETAISETINIGEYYELDNAAFFETRGTVDVRDNDGNVIGTVPANLRVDIQPVLEEACEDYAIMSINRYGGDTGVVVNLEGVGVDADKVIYYSDLNNQYGGTLYFVKQGAEVKLTIEMEGYHYILGEKNGKTNPEISWDGELYEELLPQTDDAKGPLTYTYKFQTSLEAQLGRINVYKHYDANAALPHPINLKAYHSAYDSFDPELIAIENAMWDAVIGDDVSFDQGIIWSKPGGTVEINTDTSALNPYMTGAELYVYKTGTKTAVDGITNPVTSSFIMPNYPIDLVYENGTVYRVTTEVICDEDESGGTANIVVNSVNGYTPKVGSTVYTYITNIADGYEFESITWSSNVTPAENDEGGWTFTMPSGDVSITVKLNKLPAPGNPHTITVKPLVGQTGKLYDVAFWTYDSTGRYEETGRTGITRAGSTVYYAVYPTNWEASGDYVDAAYKFVVSDFTINGLSPTEFHSANLGNEIDPFVGINSDQHPNIGYYPYDYNSSTLVGAGSFIMPDDDVVFEITGYQKERQFSFSLEAYDQYGNRLPSVEWYFNTQGVYPNGDGWIYLENKRWRGGVAHLEAGDHLEFNVPKLIQYYALESVQLEINGSLVDSNQMENINNLYPASSDSWNYYRIKPLYLNTGVVKVYYTDVSRKFTITGFEQQMEGWHLEGEAGVQYGDSYDKGREVTLMPGADGKYTTRVKLYGLSSDYARGIMFELPASGTGFTATLVERISQYAIYDVTISDANITIPIKKVTVPQTLDLRGGSVNSQNNMNFKYVTFGSTTYSELTDKLRASAAPRITKVSLANKNPSKFNKTVVAGSGGTLYNETDFKIRGQNIDINGVETGLYRLQVNIRELFDLADDYAFPIDDITIPEEYVFTIEWTWGANWSETEKIEIIFELGRNLYKPGELTHACVVQDANGDWRVVHGASKIDMEARLRTISSATPLLTFVSDGDKAFTPDGEEPNFQLTTEDDVVMNGHAFFRVTPQSILLDGSGLTIREDGEGNVTITSRNMSLGTNIIPLWYPVQIGSSSTDGVKFGTDTLQIRLKKGVSYNIPTRYPVYSKDGYATAEDAKEAWLNEIEDMRKNMVVIEPFYWKGESWSVDYYDYDEYEDTEVEADIFGAEISGNSLSVSILGYSGGLEAGFREIYLLYNGFDMGGIFCVQIPGMQEPTLRVELVSASTNNTAVIPITNIWAEGEAAFRLPDFLGGGYGADVKGVFNTYTQDFGFEGGLNIHFFEIEGSFYMARSERLKIPVIDSFYVNIGGDAVFAGIGIPPVPAQIIELKGASGGISGLAATIDWDPRYNTIPPLRITFGASFSLVEVFGFSGELWREALSGGISVEGNFELGPLQFSLIKDASFSFGIKDGPFTYYEEGDQGSLIKGKKSLLFFINASCTFSVFGIVDGGGGFSISLTMSPFLWEKRGGFSDFNDLVNFLKFNVTASGALFASVNFPLTNWTVASADVRIDIIFEPGPDMDLAPFGFNKFEFVSQTKFLCVTTTQRFNLLDLYPIFKQWVIDQVAAAKKAKTLSVQDYAEIQMMALNTLLSEPDETGLIPDPNYKGETVIQGLGSTVAVSTERNTAAANPAQGIMAMSGITQDSANIKVESNGSSYTHYVRVPNDGKTYILQVEGLGGEQLTAADLRLFKPGTDTAGSAMQLRELTGEVNEAQAEQGYNCGIIDGVLYISLSDYGSENHDYNKTVHGEWRVISSKPFKSSLVEAVGIPGVKSVEISGNNLTIEFENLGPQADGYYYDVELERKGDPDIAAFETLTIVKNEPYTAAVPVVIDLTDIGGTGKFNINDIAESGEWYARVVLRQGGVQDFEIDGVTQSVLMTDFVSDKISRTPYTVSNTVLATATWTPNLQVLAGGNQSINVAFDPATAPTDMIVDSYNIAVYDTVATQGNHGVPVPAMRTTIDAEGRQSSEPMVYTIQAGEPPPTRYEYKIADIPEGSYTVGVTPVYADLIQKTTDSLSTFASEPATTTSPVTHAGGEHTNAETVDITAATPPSLTLSVTGGNMIEQDGVKYIFAGDSGVITAETEPGATVTFANMDGTPIASVTVTKTEIEELSLVGWNGETLVITAEKAGGDSTLAYVTIYSGLEPSMLLPDNYDDVLEKFIFTAYLDTGSYTITGQTDPGASVGNVITDESGRFAIPGKLDAGVDNETITLSVANAAGMLTMREVEVVRGTDAAPIYTVTFDANSGSVSQTTAPTGTGGKLANLPIAVRGGYRFDGWFTAATGGSQITDSTVFIADTTVYAHWTYIGGGNVVVPQNNVIIATPTNGRVTVSPNNPTTGTTVTITVTPNEGYALDQLKVTDENGTSVPLTDNGDGTFTYTQPNSSVTINATFKSDDDTTQTTPEWINPFTDVSDSAWYYDDVGYVYTHGLMNGTSENPMRFSPNTPLTRGMIVTILYRQAGSPSVSGLPNPFDDVAAGNWYTDAIIWAAANGIVSGYGNGKFGTDDNITRQDLAVILNRYAGFAIRNLPTTRDYSGFIDDADIANYAKEAIEQFFRAGIVNGKPGDKFDPKGNATRAETAAMLHRFLEESTTE